MAVSLLVFMVSIALIPTVLGGSRLLTTSSAVEIIYCDRDYSCLNCSAVRVCAPTSDGKSLYETSRFTCPTSNPYCNYTTGSCSSSPDPYCYSPPSNATVSTNFTCMRDGFFPDPTNCSLYYNCKDEVAYQYTCSYPTPYYHPGLKDCTTTRYYCTDYSSSYLCQYSSYYGRKVPIYYTSNYFMYCGVYYNNYNYNILAVDRCIGDYNFDFSAQTCRFTCPHTGLFMKNDDCANYFKCTLKTRGDQSYFLITNMTCPPGQAFLETDFQCVERALVPNCNKPYSDLYSK